MSDAGDSCTARAERGAKGICTRKALERSSLDVDFTAIDGALLEIAKQVKELDDIRTWTETIKSNGEKILVASGSRRRSWRSKARC